MDIVWNILRLRIQNDNQPYFYSRARADRITTTYFYAPTEHFPLILWPPLLPSMVHEEGAEGGTRPLLSGTTSPPWTLLGPPLISWFLSMFALRRWASNLQHKSNMINISHTQNLNLSSSSSSSFLFFFF